MLELLVVPDVKVLLVGVGADDEPRDLLHRRQAGRADRLAVGPHDKFVARGREKRRALAGRQGGFHREAKQAKGSDQGGGAGGAGGDGDPGSARSRPLFAAAADGSSRRQ